MALKVDIEESIWTDPRIYHLASLLKIRPSSAVGEVAAVWRIAQNRDTDTFGLTDLDLLTELKGLTEKMAICGLIEINGKIARLKGVAERLEKIRANKLRQSNNAKKRWSHDANGMPVACHSDATAMPPQCHSDATAMPNHALILRLKPELKLKPNTPPTPPRGEKTSPADAGVARAPTCAREKAADDGVVYEQVEAEIVSSTPKPKNKTKKKPQVSEADADLGKRWFEWTATVAPHIHASPASFSVGIFETKRALARSIPDGDLDGLLDALFNFIRQDKFWGRNCLSPCGLLTKSSNGLRKVDNVIKSMRGDEFREKQKTLINEAGEGTDWSKYI